MRREGVGTAMEHGSTGRYRIPISGRSGVRKPNERFGRSSQRTAGWIAMELQIMLSGIVGDDGGVVFPLDEGCLGPRENTSLLCVE